MLNDLLGSKYDMSWSWATRSQTFDRTWSTEIGLLLFRISWSRVLSMGITLAIFQEIGKMSDSNVAFMIDVDGDKIGKQSLITRIGILSILGPLPLAIDIMTFCICLHPTAFIVKLTILPIVPRALFSSSQPHFHTKRPLRRREA